MSEIVRRAWWLVLLLGVAVSGCGVGTEGRASRVADEDVPFALLAPPTTVPETTTTTNPGTAPVQFFLVLGDGLVELDRELVLPISLPRLISVLGEGPTPGEQDLGVTTYLPDGSGVDGVRLVGGIAYVELGEAFLTVPQDRQRLALAQLVFTLTGRPGVGRVLFTIDGQPTEVPRGDGTLTSESVSRDTDPVPVRTVAAS